MLIGLSFITGTVVAFVGSLVFLVNQFSTLEANPSHLELAMLSEHSRFESTLVEGAPAQLFLEGGTM